MTNKSIFLILVALFFNTKVFSSHIATSYSSKFIVEWQSGSPKGAISATNGQVERIEILNGKGSISGLSFVFKSAEARLAVVMKNAKTNVGSGSTLIHVKTNKQPFSFLLRDVDANNPIYIPDYGVIVTNFTDSRSLSQIVASIKNKNTLTNIQQYNTEPEESFDKASAVTRNQSVPTWLGLSRDMRIFILADNKVYPGNEMSSIKIMNSAKDFKTMELSALYTEFGYMLGRGQSVEKNITRRLHNGVLPILNTTLVDGDIEYKMTSFVALEKSNMANNNKYGTHFLIADKHSAGHTFTNDEKITLESLLNKQENEAEETVLYSRVVVTNKSKSLRYAWLKIPKPGASWWPHIDYQFDSITGISTYNTGRVFCVSKLNGKALPDEEISVLLKSEEQLVLEFYVPHSPLELTRAKNLIKQDFDNKLADIELFWSSKLKKAARVSVPEKRITEMLQAGLLHLDLTTYGKEPDQTLAPNVGVYSPIGTESSPIIQYYLSMGWTDVAKRTLNYFLDRQKPNGKLQSFGEYSIETGGVLWNLGEYFRYTKDLQWVKENQAKFIKAADFLINWRNENKIDKLKGRGYGMISGRVADPEDDFHQYMLNGFAYLGIRRVAEMLQAVNNSEAERIDFEAKALKADIRESFSNNLALSPVVPMGDGSWLPTVPPWAESLAPRNLHFTRETFQSHGTVTAPDFLLGPLFLVFCEVYEPEELEAKMLFDYQTELYLCRNAGFSQPYYSRHNTLQAQREMVKPFLKTFYNTFSATSDRETYSFWEHLYWVTSHKTHEEGWFLMEARQMLYLERNDTLRLLSTIPRIWLENGNKIDMENVNSYFGTFSLYVNSNVDHGFIDASVELDPTRLPAMLVLRIPHPQGKKPLKVVGGEYNEKNETVELKPKGGRNFVRLEF